MLHRHTPPHDIRQVCSPVSKSSWRRHDTDKSVIDIPYASTGIAFQQTLHQRMRKQTSHPREHRATSAMMQRASTRSDGRQHENMTHRACSNGGRYSDDKNKHHQVTKSVAKIWSWSHGVRRAAFLEHGNFSAHTETAYTERSHQDWHMYPVCRLELPALLIPGAGSGLPGLERVGRCHQIQRAQRWTLKNKQC